jgi:signal transduction histidine kinase
MNTSLKLESDAYSLQLEAADICELTRRICVEFYEDITSTGKDFDIDIPDEPIKAMVDMKLFGRVINNLLANANKYNSTGKWIGINLRPDSEDIVIEVMDDGEPIDEEFVPKMFDEFARGDATRKTDGGTGLGLAISRKIVEKHNGTLKYILAEGKNCFSVRLSRMI